jgi:phosphoribosylanthranilate isomerase
MKKDAEGNVPITALERLTPYQAAVDAVLIDAPGGGTGQTFDWEAIEEYNQAAEKLGITLYVAGGLHEGNVQELLRTYAPSGIDVSSGVETDGRKDIEKIRLFVRRVMEA